MFIHNYHHSIVRISNNTRVNEKLWLLVDMKNYSDAKFASTQVNHTKPGSWNQFNYCSVQSFDHYKLGCFTIVLLFECC